MLVRQRCWWLKRAVQVGSGERYKSRPQFGLGIRESTGRRGILIPLPWDLSTRRRGGARDLQGKIGWPAQTERSASVNKTGPQLISRRAAPRDVQSSRPPGLCSISAYHYVKLISINRFCGCIVLIPLLSASRCVPLGTCR
jgi:hypothetical protein